MLRLKFSGYLYLTFAVSGLVPVSLFCLALSSGQALAAPAAGTAKTAAGVPAKTAADADAEIEDDADDVLQEPKAASSTHQSKSQAEKPPAPEPPYPGSEKGAFAADPSLVKTKAPEDLAERPANIDEDGNYIYDVKKPTVNATKPATKPAAKSAAETADQARPSGFDEDGSYVFDTKPAPQTYKGLSGGERPVEMTASGEYQYKVESTQATRSASFHLGVITPPSIRNPDNGLSFSDIYGSHPSPMLTVDYEFKRLFQNAGRLGLKAGTGLMVASGPGHFADPARAAEVPIERYTFFMFPNTLTANYRFQYADKQVFVPFLEGGAGYYTFAELRDDGAKPKIGGALVALGGGGAYFQMDWIDPQAMRQLDLEYGISHLWLSLEVRSSVGLNSALNFTSNSANTGFMMEF